MGLPRASARRTAMVLAAVVVGTTLAVPQSAGAHGGDVILSPPARPVAAAPAVVPEPTDEILVTYAGGVRAAARARAAAGVAQAEPYGDGWSTEVVRVPPGMSTARALRSLRADPAVATAEPNRRFSITGAVPDDANFTEQWGLHNVGQFGWGTADADVDAPEGWTAASDAPDVVVAVVDTGIDLGHADLADQIWTNPGEFGDGKENNGLDDDNNGYIDDWRGWDWVGEDNQPQDLNGHGTHVAGILGARGNNGVGVSGVAWDVRIMPLRALDAGGGGTLGDISAAFRYAGQMGADVVNASLGAYGAGEPAAMRAAIAASPDTLFVVAAGNAGADNDTSPVWPCNHTLTNLICVAASDEDDARPLFSNYGNRTVDIAAPGVNVLSAVPRALAARTGTYALTDSPDGHYRNNALHWVRRDEPINLLGATDCEVRWHVMIDSDFDGSEIEDDDDWLAVEASSDNVGWTRIGRVAGSTGGTYHPSAIRSDLGAFEGDPEVWIRFRFRSSPRVVFDGAAVDDVDVVCTLGDPGMPEESFESGDLSGWSTGGTGGAWAVSDTAGQLEYMNGTSMATPMVAGAAALVWAQRPPAVARATWRRHAVNVLRGGAASRRAWMRRDLRFGGRLNLDRTLAYTGDLTAPAGVAVGGPALRRGFQRGTAFRLRFAANDVNGSGVRSYDVRFRRARYDAGRFSARRAWRTDLQAHSAPFTGTRGATYCFDARARDRAFNRSGFSRDRCTAIPLSDRQLRASGAWDRLKASGAYRGTYSLATRRGAVLRQGDVRYRTLAIVASTCPRCGKVAVLRGGKRLGTIDLSGRFDRRRVFVVDRSARVRGPARITIEVLSRGKPVMIEGLGVSRV